MSIFLILQVRKAEYSTPPFGESGINSLVSMKSDQLPDEGLYVKKADHEKKEGPFLKTRQNSYLNPVLLFSFFS